MPGHRLRCSILGARPQPLEVDGGVPEGAQGSRAGAPSKAALKVEPFEEGELLLDGDQDICGSCEIPICYVPRGFAID